MQKQRAAEAPSPPALPVRQASDEPAAEHRLAPGDRGDLFAVANDEPERVVVVLTQRPPLVERQRVKPPLVRERLRAGGLKRTLLAVPKDAELEVVGQLGLRRIGVEVDRHHVVSVGTAR